MKRGKIQPRSPREERAAYHSAMLGSVLHHTGMGARTAASANGRLAGETLRRAAQHPEAYRDLVVRVAGFTAYFVSLPAELQQEIIARAEASFPS